MYGILTILRRHADLADAGSGELLLSVHGHGSPFEDPLRSQISRLLQYSVYC
jgi:hypothetical protein